MKGTDRALAMSVDGNGRFVLLDPRQGARLALAEAARNVACAGAVPIGASNCLNFGNPERPEIMWQFAEAVAGLGEACRALEIPITGGNVSLYNETDGKAILPTPVIGVVGLIEHADRMLTRVFPAPGLDVVLLGEGRGELGGSEYLLNVHGLVRGVPPVLDLNREKSLLALMATLAAERRVRSAHDCAEGGLAVTLAECSFGTGGVGLTVDVPAADAPAAWASASTLFSESASRVVVSATAENVGAVLARARDLGVPAREIGTTGTGRISVSINGRKVIDMAVGEGETIWDGALGKFFKQRAA